MLTRLLASLVIVLAVHSSLPADEWQAGAAKVNITPEGPMWMAGYASRSRPAEEKQTELWAKALVLKDPGGRLGLLITLDLIGVDRDLSLELRRALSEKHKLELAQIAVCTSHTHSGPVVARNLRPMHYLSLDEAQRKMVDAYATRLTAAVQKASAEAFKNLAPCRLSHGSGEATFAANRRNNQEAEFAALKAAGKVVGPHDHDVPVLAVRDENGKLAAVVFGYACHATVLDGYGWSGDYPGYAQMALEERHPEAVALFWAGCGGDQNPLPRRKVEYAQNYGRQLADAVDAVLSEEMQAIDGPLKTAYVEIDLKLAKLPTAVQLTTDAESKDKYVAARAKHLLEEIAAGRPLPDTYPYPIGHWQLGDEVEWFFLGGEVVVDFALRLKAERREKNTWVAAYANDVMAYIPSRRVLGEGGYEGGGAMVYYGLPAPWAETVETDIITAAHKLAK